MKNEIEYLRSQNCAQVILIVVTGNESVEFYRKLGLRETYKIMEMDI